MAENTIKLRQLTLRNGAKPLSSLELSFGKKFSAVFLENPFIRKVLIAETAFFTDFMLVRSDLRCVFETGKKLIITFVSK